MRRWGVAGGDRVEDELVVRQRVALERAVRCLKIVVQATAALTPVVSVAMKAIAGRGEQGGVEILVGAAAGFAARACAGPCL